MAAGILLDANASLIIIPYSHIRDTQSVFVPP